MSGRREGQPVRVDTDLADEDGTLRRGATGRVTGANHTHRGADGIERTTVQMEDGTVCAIPTKALRNTR